MNTHKHQKIEKKSDNLTAGDPGCIYNLHKWEELLKLSPH